LLARRLLGRSPFWRSTEGDAGDRRPQHRVARPVFFFSTGYVPLSTAGTELLFEVFSQRYERAPPIVTSNLPFDEWTGVFGSERLTGAARRQERLL
jgi:hypothetical protein